MLARCRRLQAMWRVVPASVAVAMPTYYWFGGRDSRESFSTSLPVVSPSTPMDVEVAGDVVTASDGYIYRPDELPAAERVRQWSSAQGVKDVTTFLKGAACAPHANGAWRVESSTFPHPTRTSKLLGKAKDVEGGSVVDPTKTFVQISRLRHDYSGDVPTMRIVAWMPGVDTRTVERLLVVPPLRRAWDANYRMFDVVAGARCSLAVFDDISVHGNPVLPTSRKVVEESPLTAWLRPRFVPIERVWACHRTSTTILEKIGLRPWYFAYERLVARGAFPPTAADATGDPPTGLNACASQILFRSIRPTGEQGAVATTSSAAAALAPVLLPGDVDDPKTIERFFAGKAQARDAHTTMHAQEVLLVPLTKAAVRDASTLHEVVETSGEVGPPGATLVESLGRLCRASSPGEQEHAGVLMIMTSTNVVPVPALPHWAKVYLAKNVTEGAYSRLAAAAAQAKQLAEPWAT